MYKFRFFVFLILLSIHPLSFAWENHADMTALVLEDWAKQDKRVDGYLHQKVKAESLTSFLQATKDKLPVKLQEIEKWLVTNEQGYQPRPKKIAYDPNKIQCHLDLPTCFKKAIRINLDLPIKLIVNDANHVYSRLPKAKKISELKSLILPNLKNRKINYTLVTEGSLLLRSDVIATASIQPDFGFDVFLYENNPSSFGKLYGFGKQPLGLANIPFSSQILFHMSAYREGRMVYTFMPRLKENYPEARAYQYLELSKFAAQIGHAYWAAVFLGWGLHYLQDMTQPYHSELSLGLNRYSAFYILVKAALGNTQPLNEFKNIQANRHILLEGLTTHLLTSTRSPYEQYKTILSQGLKNHAQDKQAGKCNINDLYIRNNMNIYMETMAPEYVSLLIQTMPPQYVENPDFDVAPFNQYHELFIKQMSAAQRLKFSQELLRVLTLFGSYTRSCIQSYGIADGLV